MFLMSYIISFSCKESNLTKKEILKTVTIMFFIGTYLHIDYNCT